MIIMFIIYSKAVDEEMVEIVKESADGYTKFVDVQGEGHREPQLGTHIWPGKNNCIMVAVEKNKEKNIIEKTTELKEKFPGTGIHILTANLK